MRLIPVIAGVAALTLTACNPVEEVVEIFNIDTEAPAQQEPAPIYMSPNADPEQMCNGLVGGIEIPCREVLDVCIADQVTGELTSKWVPDVVRCTADHPTISDVCRLVPEQIEFYGYTREECDAN